MPAPRGVPAPAVPGAHSTLWGPRLISSNPTVQGPGFAFVALVIRAYLDDPIGVSGTCSKAHNDVPMSIGLSGIWFEWHGLLYVGAG